MKTRTAMTAVALAVVLGASGAEASTVDFTITEPSQPTIMFMLPQMPVPDGYSPGGYFYILNVPETVGGVPSTGDYYFYSLAAGGGYNNLFGAQYYTAPESNPTFITGVYPNQFDANTGGYATVTIAAATPLPASWAMLLGGLGALGFLAHRGARRHAVA